MPNYPILSRKDVLKILAAPLLPVRLQANEVDPPVIPGKRPMIVHNEYPEDLETPLEAFGSWLTPNDAFFVRQHLPRPQVDASAWTLEVAGRVSKPLRLSLADLRALPQQTVPATLECTGNGRRFYTPRVLGLPWGKGGIGNAEWRGPRLADILAAAGVSSGELFVDADGADRGLAKTPDFVRSIPLSKALHEATLVALQMNGAPLPEIHGGPMRLVIPGWNGANWVKWVRKLMVVEQPHSGFYMNPAYKYPRYTPKPGTAVKPEDLAALEAMPVKSFFYAPQSGSVHAGGRIELAGVAWAGEQRVARVEISADRGRSWREATLGREDFPSAWRLWQYEWSPSNRGFYVLMCRATDRAGNVQPMEAAWNPSGYLWNSVDRLEVIVEG